MDYRIIFMYRWSVGKTRWIKRLRAQFRQLSLIKWLKPRVLVPFAWLLLQVNASAQTTGDVTGGMQQGLGLLMKFGFIAGCVMVMAGFMAAKRDENWKMTVIYGLGVAGAVSIMTALYNYFGASGASIKPSW